MKIYAVYYIGSIQYDKPISITVDCSCVLVTGGSLQYSVRLNQPPMHPMQKLLFL